MLTAVETDVDGILQKLFVPAAQRDPHPAYAWLRREHPVLRTGQGLWVFSRYDDVATIARNPAFWVKDATWFDRHAADWREHPGLRLFLCSLVFRNGNSHQRVRRALGPAFTPARLRGLAEVARSATSDHLDLLPGDPDLHRSYSAPIAQLTTAALLGVPPEDGQFLYEQVQPLLALLDPFFGERTVERADQAAESLLPYLSDLLEQRRRQPRDDLASDAARLGDDDAIPALFLGLAAGFDTTVALIDNLALRLLAAPDQAAMVAAHPQAVEPAIQESLRIDPPLHLITRVTAREIELGGAVLGAGQEVMALIAAANRDRSKFSEPEVFAPGRTSGELLSFGGGPHFCLGAQLGKLEASIAVPALVRRFPRLHRSGPARANRRVTLPGWTSLPVTLENE